MSDTPTPLVALLGVLISAFVALHLRRKNASSAAAGKFRAALLNALSGMYPIPANWPKNVDGHLRQIFPALQSAVEEFRPYVPWRSRRSYDRAWFVYRLGEDGREIDKQLYHQYMGFTSPDEPVVDPKVTFHANVKRLLAFAGEI
jgi:hypothetical protein